MSVLPAAHRVEAGNIYPVVVWEISHYLVEMKMHQSVDSTQILKALKEQPDVKELVATKADHCVAWVLAENCTPKTTAEGQLAVLHLRETE